MHRPKKATHMHARIASSQAARSKISRRKCVYAEIGPRVPFVAELRVVLRAEYVLCVGTVLGSSPLCLAALLEPAPCVLRAEKYRRIGKELSR